MIDQLLTVLAAIGTLGNVVEAAIRLRATIIKATPRRRR